MSKKDLSAVFELWQAYRHGAVRRKEIETLTRHPKYVLSPLRFVDR